MIASTRILLEIKVSHEYIGDNPAIRLIEIGPNIINAPINLRIKQLPDRILVYDKAQDQVKLLRPLIFPVWFQDKEFGNYTEINLTHDNPNNKATLQIVPPKILLFSISGSGTTKQVLQNKDASLLPVQPIRFSYRLTSSEMQSLKKVTVTPISGKAITLPLPSYRLDDDYLFDLSNEGPGVYEATFIFSDQSPKTYTFIASDEFHFQPPPAALLVQPELFNRKTDSNSQYNFNDLFSENELQLVEGIGPKLESILNRMGIDSWTLLASTHPNDLRKILTNTDPRYRIHNPESWPEQARLALQGRWNELVGFQHQLHAGRNDIGDGDTPAKVERRAQKRTGISHKGNSADPISLTLQFQARSTYWRYFLLGLSPEDWPDVSLAPIKVGHKRITFSQESAPVKLPNGLQALVMCSQDPIPFREQPSWRVRLATPYLPDGLVLPAAQPGILKMIGKPTVKKPWVSEIFVNL